MKVMDIHFSAVAQVFVSVTLSNEKLTVEAEKERQLLSEWLVKLRTKMGEQPPGQAEAGLPPRPPKGPTPVTTTSPESCQEPEEIYDDVNDAENGECKTSSSFLNMLK